MMTYRIWPGKPQPLGAFWDGNGVNFALFSEHARKVELCLFRSPEDRSEAARLPLTEQTDGVWHAYLPDVKPGQLYGYRVHGAWDPSSGHRFNSHKVLLDPYARGIGRNVGWSDAMFAYRYGQEDTTFDDTDNAWCAVLGEVIDAPFDWGDDRPLRTPWHRTLIYELHVKGQTQLHPRIPAPIRGTYAGLASRASIEHLRSLGVTAVELMPVHARIDDRHLVTHGLRNYWGYNTLSFFAPEPHYSAGDHPADVINEFRSMVRRLHQAGIEVILDVVYNHTGEGSELGPSISLRGIDNASYYRLLPNNRRYYQDFTGCGNTLNMQCPRVLQLIMDSLRYWVQEMHVDGFRFDLASALARELHDVDRLSAFFDIILQDPVLSQVKLIAEPWDLGSGGYQVGNFPHLWSEWNGRYRDSVRRFWKGEKHLVSEMATRLSGSSDLYQQGGRRPWSSINFITAHDGFTLLDLVTWEHKLNHANLEGNRDGESHNNNWNCGVEGTTQDPQIRTLRARQRRNLLTTLMVSQGVPMIRGGDELGKTQLGNNNPYCQDNEISWLQWELDEEQQGFLEFTRQLMMLWKSQPVLHRSRFFQGRRPLGSTVKDIAWLDSSGEEITDELWQSDTLRVLGMRLNGETLDESDQLGRPVTGDTLLVFLNPTEEQVSFRMPRHRQDDCWSPVLDTFENPRAGVELCVGDEWSSAARSITVFRLSHRPGSEEAHHSPSSS